MERLFNIDAQLLFDTVVMACSMLVLFTAMSYLFFNPVRDMLENRKKRVAEEQEAAKAEHKEAIAYKEEYELKLKAVDKEAQEIFDNFFNELRIFGTKNVRTQFRTHYYIILKIKFLYITSL